MKFLCSGGACVVAPGGVCGCSGGHAWLLFGGGVHGCSRRGVCMVAPGACVVAPGGGCVVVLGGMHGCSLVGACMVAPGGGCAWLLRGSVLLLWGVCMVVLGGVHGCLGGMGGCSGGDMWLLPVGHAWDTTRYGDTVNERAVRILLECILVKLANIIVCTTG